MARLLSGMEDSAGLLRRILRPRRHSYTVKLRAIMEAEYPWVIEDLKNMVCPFCGRRARSWWGMWRHIRKSHELEVRQVAMDVVAKYYKSRRVIERVHYGNVERFLVRPIGVWYSSFGEAYLALKSLVSA